MSEIEEYWRNSKLDYLDAVVDAIDDQNELIKLMTINGFSNTEYRNLTNGVSAIHSGWKI